MRGVILDLDGVLRHFPAQARAERERGHPVGTVAGVAFTPDLLGPVTTGRMTHEEWCDRVAQRLGEMWGDHPAAHELVDAWSAEPGEIDAGVLDHVREVRREVPVVLLTNATSRLRRDLDRLGVTAEVDAVVSSAEIGVAKPHPAAYEHALAIVGEVRGETLRAVDVLVVDDSATNVAAAAALGHPTHHFRELAGLRAATGAARAESVREAPHTRARGAARTE
jgi:putative hydrolase of the HAD superfamily